MIAAAFSILAVVAIIVFLLAQGIPAFAKIGFFDFLFGGVWKPSGSDTYAGEISGSYGILTMLVGTVYATAGALIIGGLLGYFTAVYISKFCPKKLKKILTQIVNLLAGIPSVIYGFFGMQVLLPALGFFSANGSGSGLLAVSLILGLMISPTVISLSVTAIDAVPESYYENARALGATHAQAVFGAVVPAAKSGIAASFILGIGRALGETMAVIMIAGNNPVFPSTLFSSFRTMTANVVLEMGYAGELQMGALIATGCVLLFFALVINVLFRLVSSGRKSKKATPDKDKPDMPGRLTHILKMRPRWFTGAKKILSYAMAGITVASLLIIIGFLLVRGIPYITTGLLFGEFAYGGAPTIASSIVSTLMLVGLTLVIAVPLGVATAIFLSEYTKKGSKIMHIIRTAVEVLSGIPSVVYGLFGMIFFCVMLNLGTTILAGSLTMTIMIIPVIVRSTEEALIAVPQSYREGSFALGAGKARTIFTVVLPSAFPGILAAVILAMGRVISESAPLMFTMGASMQKMPSGYLSPGTSLAVAMYVLAGEGLHINEAYATACVLLILVFTLNILSTLLVGRLQKKMTKA